MIPLAKPTLGEAEEQAVIEVLRSGQLSLGPKLEEFEHKFAERLGVPHACAVSSGTAYQDQPVRTVFVGPGDGEYAAFQPGAANAMVILGEAEGADARLVAFMQYAQRFFRLG